jgi:hypothetical protein
MVLAKDGDIRMKDQAMYVNCTPDYIHMHLFIIRYDVLPHITHYHHHYQQGAGPRVWRRGDHPPLHPPRLPLLLPLGLGGGSSSKVRACVRAWVYLFPDSSMSRCDVMLIRFFNHTYMKINSKGKTA